MFWRNLAISLLAQCLAFGVVLPLEAQSDLHQPKPPTSEEMFCINFTRDRCERFAPDAACDAIGGIFKCSCGGKNAGKNDDVEIKTIHAFDWSQKCFEGEHGHATRDPALELQVNANLDGVNRRPWYLYKMKSGVYCGLEKPGYNTAGRYTFVVICPVEPSLIETLRTIRNRTDRTNSTSSPSSNQGDRASRSAITPQGAIAMLKPTRLLSPVAGAQFDQFPRTTLLQWAPTQGAANYRVEIEAYNLRTNQWFTLLGILGFPKEIQLKETQFQFNFPGKQRGRWRVFAVDQRGVLGTPSEWREFNYLR